MQCTFKCAVFMQCACGCQFEYSCHSRRSLIDIPRYLELPPVRKRTPPAPPAAAGLRAAAAAALPGEYVSSSPSPEDSAAASSFGGCQAGSASVDDLRIFLPGHCAATMAENLPAGVPSAGAAVATGWPGNPLPGNSELLLGRSAGSEL